eukprot:Skav235635  [mRNA]  locus=scaffold358:431091:433904:+ [translate_table: standard]
MIFKGSLSPGSSAFSFLAAASITSVCMFVGGLKRDLSTITERLYKKLLGTAILYFPDGPGSKITPLARRNWIRRKASRRQSTSLKDGPWKSTKSTSMRPPLPGSSLIDIPSRRKEVMRYGSVECLHK